MFNFVQGQGRREFQPQEYLQYFEDQNLSLTPLVPPQPLATAEDWAKGGIFQRSRVNDNDADMPPQLRWIEHQIPNLGVVCSSHAGGTTFLLNISGKQNHQFFSSLSLANPFANILSPTPPRTIYISHLYQYHYVDATTLICTFQCTEPCFRITDIFTTT